MTTVMPLLLHTTTLSLGNKTCKAPDLTAVDSDTEVTADTAAVSDLCCPSITIMLVLIYNILYKCTLKLNNDIIEPKSNNHNSSLN